MNFTIVYVQKRSKKETITVMPTFQPRQYERVLSLPGGSRKCHHITCFYMSYVRQLRCPGQLDRFCVPRFCTYSCVSSTAIRPPERMWESLHSFRSAAMPSRTVMFHICFSQVRCVCRIHFLVLAKPMLQNKLENLKDFYKWNIN